MMPPPLGPVGAAGRAHDVVVVGECRVEVLGSDTFVRILVPELIEILCYLHGFANFVNASGGRRE